MRTPHTLIRQFTLWLGLGLLLIQPSLHAASEPIERIEWNKIPITLQIKVGHERMVHVPGSVKVGVPASLEPLLRTQSVDGTIYFLAHAPFDATRIMVRTLDGGQVLLFDVSASESNGPTHPVQVFVNPVDETKTGRPASPDARHAATTPYSYVALTRFATQQLYAPARLLHDRPSIIRIPVARESLPLLRGGSVDAQPLVAWRAGDRYLTAVKLTNRTQEPQTLDPRDLRGRWLTATFQHHRLLPAGSEADTTAVYLISNRPFEASR